MSFQMFSVLVVQIFSSLSCLAAPTQSHAARIPEGVMLDWLDTKVKPVVPATGVSGTVVLRVLIAEDGHVMKVVPVSGPEILYVPYVQAVKRWVYIPYVWNGRKLRVETTVTLVLNKGDAEPFEPTPAGAPGAGSYTPVAPLQVTEAQSKVSTRVSANVLQALLLHSVPPIYTKEAKAAHVSGAVVLHVLIGHGGHVEEATPVSGPELLRPAAEEAVCQWEYKPYLLNGKAMKMESTVTVNFALTAAPRPRS